MIKTYDTREKCIKFLETIRWGDKIVCPYCNSHKISNRAEKSERIDRHQCQVCKKSFTVLVGTIFHKAHKLPEWFQILILTLNSKKGESSYQVARNLGMRQATVWHIQKRIREALSTKESELLKGIIKMDETYIGGKPRLKGSSKRGRGTNKTPVVGLTERNGEVRTQVIGVNDKMNFKTLERIFKNNVDTIKSVLITDEYRGYSPMAASGVSHAVINYQIEYVNGDIYTNTIEGFWSLIKRA